MNKSEAKKFTNQIKGYYNSQFFIDDYVLQAWYETLEPYEIDDVEEHFKKYLKNNPDVAPKPHTFKKGLLTKKEKEELKNSKYLVECNLCHRWMSLQKYNEHYDNCLDIEYLVNIAKQKGEMFTREDLENYEDRIITKLLMKYKPNENNWYKEMVEDGKNIHKR